MRTDHSKLTASSDLQGRRGCGTDSAQPGPANAALPRQSRQGSSLYASACVSLSVLMAVRTALADPTGGQVTVGNGTITQSGNSTIINQQSQNLAINWSSFSVGADESVRFNQPGSSAIALNRVVGQNPSAILGNLSSNGQVFILNPNGVLFGKSAQVDVGGLVASSLDLSDAGLLAGYFQFSAAGNAPGPVVNQGKLTAAAGGYLALLGPTVTNSGTMKVTSGTVLLAAADKVSLQLNNGSLVSYSIDRGALNALAENDQLIEAAGGRVFLSAMGADAISKAVVNNTGIIEAQTIDHHGGVIRLLGDSAVGQVNVAGTLDASAPGGGDGGAIETSAAQVKVADGAHVTTAAPGGKTGSWLIDPTDFTIAASGGDISGATLGGELASSNITLSSTSGRTSGNGDLFVDDAVGWSANTTLTLSAVRNIQINSNISATGNSAGLALNYGSGANYYVNGAKVTLSGATPSLSIGGQAYTVINSLGASQTDSSGTTLQGMQGNLSGHYALGSDINAAPTSGWGSAGSSNQGFVAVGNSTTAFTGQLAGLGHTISNLTINFANNNDVGLFGVTGSGSIIRDVGLSGGTITANDYVGPLVGINQGTILDAWSSNSVSNVQHYAGGLVGENSGTISGSYATGNVASKNKIVGGLVGLNNSTITNSYATGTVTGPNKMVGGLVGENGGTISDSYSTGKVGGASAQMGGLVGYNTGTSGTAGTVTNSFWDKTTSGLASSDGGTGMTTAQMQTQANFTSATSANGSVNPGWNFSSVWQMYDGQTYPLLKGFLTQDIITANNVSSVYTSTAWNGSDTYTCSIANCSGLSGTISYGGTAAGAINVGNYSIVPTGLYSSQYALTFVPGQLTITPASLVISGVTASNRAYDGTLTAQLGGSATINPFGSDNVKLNGTGVGTFASKNVGTGKAVTVTGYSLSGAAAGNYTLVEPVGLTANITPASLTIAGLTANSRTYDATLNDTLSGTATISPFGTDSVALGGTPSAVFASKNVGTGKAVTVSGYTLTGADASNYILVQPTGLTANITPASLSITGLTANSKVYDATLADSLSGTAAVSAIGTDSVALGGSGTATFASKNVGTAKAVTVTGYTLSGADAGNYTLVEPSGLTANITPASLFVSGVSATNKVYDATLTDTLSGTATVSAFGTDSVALGGSGTATFASKNVGTAKSVTVSGYTLTGADAGNYTLVQPTGLTASITPASIFVSGVSATNKVYDATTTDPLSGTATVTGLKGDSVALGGTGSATFASKNVGTAKAVTVSGYTLTGADASNYSLVQPTGLTANITPANLFVSGVSATNKVYDATLADTLSGTATVAGLNGDNVALGGTGTATFASKNVGTGKAVTVTGYTLSGADASNYTLVEPTGLTANITPANLFVSGVSATTKVYDATTADPLSGTAAVTGLNGDNVALGGSGTATFASKNVGTGKAVTVTGYTLSGADAGNYILVQPTGLTANITPASLFVSGVSATNKVYDATLADTLSGSATVKALGTDNVLLGGAGTATFASKNVGTGRSVTVSGYTLSGADASNYTLIQPTGLTANITPATLNITGLTANNKVYDATTAATLSGSASVAALGNDNIALGGTGVATFSSKNVGTGKAVTVTGYTLSGADASNYTLIQPTGLTANITPATLNIIGLTANNKVYDATTAATLSGSASVAALSNDNVVLGGAGTGAFADKNVGTAKTVTVSGYTLSGADAGNYTLVGPAGLTANITPASLSIGGLTASNKVYDATVNATLSGAATVAGLGSDNVSVGGTGTAVFADKNVGTAKAVTVNGYTLSGADAGNYTLLQPTGLTANISPADLLVGGVVANNKVYDGTTTATLTGLASVTPLGTDSVSLTGSATATFASKNVGSSKLVTLSGYSMTGADAGNYTLIEPTNLTANVTPASLSITGLTAGSKVYDATTTATLSGTAAVAALGSDNVVLSGSGSGSFADKNVGSGKSVTVSGYALTGADASNYTLLEPTGLTASITPASLVISGLSANNKVYDATTAATLSGTATVAALGSDDVVLTGSSVGSFANKNAGTNKIVTVSGFALSGSDAGNYTLVAPTGLTANITPANLLLGGIAANNKVYDATTGATLSGSATVTALAGDTVALNGAGTGTFGDKNVGSDKTVTVSGYTLTGADAANYTLVEPTNLTANISPANLQISGLTANSKVYDTTLNDTLSGTATINALAGDSVALGGTGSATFGSKNAGTGKAVTVTGYTLTGTDASNYTLVEPTGLVANITPANLAIGGLTADSKVYDATTAAGLSGTATITALGTDNLVLTGSAVGSFADKNAGSNKGVTVSGYSLSGADAANYTLVEPTGLTANITPATLALTGIAANNKVYDTTTAATLSGTASVTALGSDSVNVAGTGTAAFAGKNVGFDKSVTVSGYSLSGTDAANYTLVLPTNLTANISPAQLVVSGLTANNRVYDATSTAGLSGTAAVTPLGNDSVSLGGTASATFASRNVGTGKAVTVSGFTLTGADAANYTLVEPTGLTANITPASLTVSGLTATTKVYDATTADSLAGTATIAPIGSDNVFLTGSGQGAFANKNVGNNKGVTVSGYALSGADAGNYTLVEPTGLTANITPASLVLGGISANNKVYDTTTTATLSGTASVTALGSDTVGLSGTAVAAFGDKNAGLNKAVSVSGYTLTGADAGNYTLVEPNNLTANISPANLSISGLSAANKVYDGTTAATLGGSASISAFSGDNVSLVAGSGTFADKNVGSNKPVSLGGFTLSGSDAGNYVLVAPANLTANITPRALTISATGTNRAYDGLTDATVNLTDNRVTGDVLTTGYGSAAFADPNAGSGKAISVGGISLSGADAGNYTFNTTAATIANITPAALAITANPFTKVYDGTAFTRGNGVTYAGFVNGETASVLSGSLTYQGNSQRAVNAGTYSITPGGLTSGNYAISFVSGTLTVNQAPLTITANNDTIVFNNTPFKGGNGVTYSGLVAGQTASVLGGTLTYGGTSQGAISAGTYSIIPGGLTSTNYAITFVNGTLTINPLSQAVAANRLYDNTSLTSTASSGGSETLDLTTAAAP